MTSEFSVAVHALVYLNHKGVLVSSEDLARNICTNPARVRKVMAPLKKAGFVVTREGPEGGYQIAENPAALTLRRVAQALDVCFVTASWRSGSVDMKCLVASGMAGIMDEIYGDLDELCKKRLDEISIEAIDRKIFGTKTP